MIYRQKASTLQGVYQRVILLLALLLVFVLVLSIYPEFQRSGFAFTKALGMDLAAGLFAMLAAGAFLGFRAKKSRAVMESMALETREKSLVWTADGQSADFAYKDLTQVEVGESGKSVRTLRLTAGTKVLALSGFEGMDALAGEIIAKSPKSTAFLHKPLAFDPDKLTTHLGAYLIGLTILSFLLTVSRTVPRSGLPILIITVGLYLLIRRNARNPQMRTLAAYLLIAMGLAQIYMIHIGKM
jgi:hypothetical protein